MVMDVGVTLLRKFIDIYIGHLVQAYLYGSHFLWLFFFICVKKIGEWTLEYMSEHCSNLFQILFVFYVYWAIQGHPVFYVRGFLGFNKKSIIYKKNCTIRYLFTLIICLMKDVLSNWGI